MKKHLCEVEKFTKLVSPLTSYLCFNYILTDDTLNRLPSHFASTAELIWRPRMCKDDYGSCEQFQSATLFFDTKLMNKARTATTASALAEIRTECLQHINEMPNRLIKLN